MKPNIKFGISALLAAMLLLSMAFAGAADSSKDLQNDPQLQDGKLPDFGPEVFEEMKNDPSVIAIRGTVPKIEIEEEQHDWTKKLDEITHGVSDNVPLYFHPEGPIMGCSCTGRGYMDVILEGSDINESLIDDIYGIFDRQSSQMGVHDVPLVFRYSKIPVDIGPEVFDEMKKDPKVIATRGTVPKIEEEEIQKWIENLGRIIHGVRDNISVNMSLYFYPEGPVIAYGCDSPGHIGVEFLEGSDINESLMDEIYGLFDQQGRQMGVTEVPVLFQFSEMPIHDIRYEEPPLIPGFTAITLLVAFLGLWYMR